MSMVNEQAEMTGDESSLGHEPRNALDSGHESEARSTEADANAPRRKQRRGFAAMDPARQRAIASKGGKASHEHGTGHEWTSESARAAGRKGGLASHGGRGRTVEAIASASAPVAQARSVHPVSVARKSDD